MTFPSTQSSVHRESDPPLSHCVTHVNPHCSIYYLDNFEVLKALLILQVLPIQISSQTNSCNPFLHAHLELSLFMQCIKLSLESATKTLSSGNSNRFTTHLTWYTLDLPLAQRPLNQPPSLPSP